MLLNVSFSLFYFCLVAEFSLFLNVITGLCMTMFLKTFFLDYSISSRLNKRPSVPSKEPHLVTKVSDTTRDLVSLYH